MEDRERDWYTFCEYKNTRKILIKLHAYLTKPAFCKHRGQQISLGSQEAGYESELEHFTRSGYEFLVLK